MCELQTNATENQLLNFLWVIGKLTEIKSIDYDL